MEKERIRRAIQAWKDRELPLIKSRDIEIDHLVELDHLIDIIGIRRCGKTYLMFYVIKKLLEKKVDKKAVIYINFEDRALYPLTNKLLDEVLNYIYEENLLEKEKRVFLFLDEIQAVPEWERWVRNIYDEFKGEIKIFVSGSASKIARREVAALLTGRHISLTLFPLDFKEFLNFKNVSYDPKEIQFSRKKQAQLKALLREFMEFGGFPEVALVDNELQKNEILRAYYEDILYKDVIEKFGVKEKNVMENFLKFLLLNISSYFSYKKSANYLSSLGISTSTRTLLKYTSILEEVFLLFFLPILSKKVRDQLKYPRKVYCADVGLRRVVGATFSGDAGRIYENIVFLKLKKMQSRKPNLEIYYWKNRDGGEVDFVIKEGLKVKKLIQVCQNVSDLETRGREVKALLKAMEELKIKESLIITEDFENVEEINKKKIVYQPLWKWLVE
jgi:predicted AAA+ superfamily ATPase